MLVGGFRFDVFALGKVLVTASGVAWLGAAVAKASGDGSLTAGAVGALAPALAQQ